MSWEGLGGTTSSPVAFCRFEIVSAHVCREESGIGRAEEWDGEHKLRGQYWTQAIQKKVEGDPSYSGKQWQDTIQDGIRATEQVTSCISTSVYQLREQRFQRQWSKDTYIWNSLPPETRQLKSMHASPISARSFILQLFYSY